MRLAYSDCVRVIAAAAACVVPLVLIPGLLFYFDITPKVVVILLAGAMSLVLLPHLRTGLTNLWRSRAGRCFLLLCCGQALSLALSTLLSRDALLALNGGNWRRFGCLTQLSIIPVSVAVCAWLARRKEHLVFVLRCCAIAGGVAGFYGILQYFGVDPLLSPAAYQAGEGPFTIVRPPGTLGHADYFAAWLCAAVFWSTALAMMRPDSADRRLGVSAALIALVALVLTGTRSAMAAVLAGAAFLLWRVRPVPRRRTVLMIGAAALLAAVFIASPAGAKLRARVHWAREDLYGGARLLLWRDALSMAMTRPLAGFGPDTFDSRFPAYQSLDLARAYPDFHHESPHNIFIDAFIAQGLPGLLILAGFCCAGLLASLRSRADLAAVAGAAVVALTTAHLFVSFTAVNALSFYLAIAIAVAMNVREEGTAETPADVPSKASWMVRAASATAAAVFVVFAVQLLIMDAQLGRAKAAIESKDGEAAIFHYASAERWHPAGSDAGVYFSRALAGMAGLEPNFLRRVRIWQAAIEAADRATRNDEDRQNAWYNLATLLAAQGDGRGVERCLRAASASSPSWFKPHWMLARYLSAAQRVDEARLEARAAVDRDGGKHDEVASTWRALQVGAH